MLGKVICRGLARATVCERAYKRWFELETHEKRWFADRFVAVHRDQYPVSRSNGSLQGLSAKLDEHHRDSPSVFAIFYNDIHSQRCWRFRDPQFKALLIPR